MKKSKKLLFLLTTALSCSLFYPSEKSHAKAILINYDLTEGVNVRESKSCDDDSNILGGIDYPDVYEIKGESDDYFEVEFEGKKAYVGKSWFHVLDDIKVKEDAKVYKEIKDDSEVLLDLKKDDKVNLVNFTEKDDFVKVEKYGKEGFIKIDKTELDGKDDLDKLKDKYKKIYDSVDRYISYLERNGMSLYPEEENEEVEENLGQEINRIYPEEEEIEYIYYTVDEDDVGKSAYNFATKFLGNPYVWGGTSLTNGIDCSGFTQQVYAEFGIGLPHLAQAQTNYGQTVALGEERAGDLVFFGTSLSNVSHVAIADGQGGIIHAANPRAGIITSSIGNPLLIKRIVE